MSREITAEKDDVHQPYDKLFRQNMRQIMPGIIEKVLNLNIVAFEELKDKLQTIKQLEVDTLRKVTDSDGNTYILHIEIQKDNDKNLPYRMMQYRGMLYQIYQLPVKQYVLYIGEEKLTMPCGIQEPGFNFMYPVICFNELSYKLFINAKQPEVKMLAILANLESATPLDIMNTIVTAIQHHDAEPTEKQNYLTQLRILAKLRNFTKQYELIMLKLSSFFKEEEDPFYLRGEAKGRIEGEEIGKKAAAYVFASNLITQTSFNNDKIAQLVHVPVSFVQQVREELAGK